MQADQIHLIALQVQRKYYSEPNKDSQRWISRHDQLHSDRSLPKQELPATMLSMDYTRVWYSDKCAILLASLLQLPCMMLRCKFCLICVSQHSSTYCTWCSRVSRPTCHAKLAFYSTWSTCSTEVQFNTLRPLQIKAARRDEVHKAVKLDDLHCLPDQQCHLHRRNTQQCISFWQPVAPPGYLPLGHVPSIGLDPPADPVLVTPFATSLYNMHTMLDEIDMQ